MGGRLVAVSLVLCLVLSGCIVPEELETAITEPTQTPSGEDELAKLNKSETAVLNGMNRERKKAGLPALKEDKRLTAAAEGHSKDMAKGDFFDHTGSDGSKAGDRVSAQGYRWTFYAENVACGQRTATEVLQSWLGSKAHRKNILSPKAKEAGVSVVRRKDSRCVYFWTVVFGAEKKR
jgi:uncharacterized protein YkwD